MIILKPLLILFLAVFLVSQAQEDDKDLRKLY